MNLYHRKGVNTMAKQRRTRAALEQEIQKLIDERKASEEKAAALFAKAFLTKEMKNKIADMSDAEIKEMAKKMADEVKVATQNKDGQPAEKKKSNDEIFCELLLTDENKKLMNSKDVEIIKLATENMMPVVKNAIVQAEKEFIIRQQKADKNRKY